MGSNVQITISRYCPFQPDLNREKLISLYEIPRALNFPVSGKHTVDTAGDWEQHGLEVNPECKTALLTNIYPRISDGRL
jgi:hypothetical protein